MLLILSVVSINAVRNDGIIEYAKNARTEYEKAQKEENDLLSYFEKQLETKGEVGKWVQNKTKLTKVNADKTVEELKVGDLIQNYKSSTNTAIEWRVLGAEDGKVLLVSSTNLNNKVLLSGKEGYNTGIQTLKTKCEEYDNGEGAVPGSARSIDADDINRVTGYNPLRTGTGEPYGVRGISKYLNKVTYTIKNGELHYISDVTTDQSAANKFIRFNGTELKEGESITVVNNAYVYYPVSLSLDDKIDGEVKGISAESNAYKLLFEETKTEETRYWVGTPWVCAINSGSAYGVFSVNLESLTTGSLWFSEGYGQNLKAGVRTVVALQADAQFTETGENNTYTVSVAEQ